MFLTAPFKSPYDLAKLKPEAYRSVVDTRQTVAYARVSSSDQKEDLSRLVITHKDRLLRFGAELVFSLCAAKQVEVVILNQGEDTTFFSAQLYGKKWVKKFGPKI